MPYQGVEAALWFRFSDTLCVSQTLRIRYRKLAEVDVLDGGFESISCLEHFDPRHYSLALSRGQSLGRRIR